MNATYQVSSCNFDYHPVLECATYADALHAAQKRGFEAVIKSDGKLVASWSPLYGTRVYNRHMASVS